MDYTSTSLASGAANSTVGQALGGGSYTVGFAGQGLASGNYYWRVMSDDGTATSPYSTANGGATAFIVAKNKGT